MNTQHETLSIQIKSGFNIVEMWFKDMRTQLDRIERRLDRLEVDAARAARKVDA